MKRENEDIRGAVSRKKKIIWGIGLLFSIVLGGLAFGEEACAQTSERVVRVAYYDMPNFLERDSHGECSGYCVEYLKNLGNVSGWRFEYVATENFLDGQKRLLEGKVDLLAPVQYREEMLELYDYALVPMGHEYGVLVAGSEFQDLEYEDFESFEGMKIALIATHPLTEAFREYAEANHFSYEEELCLNAPEALAELEAGNVDAAIAPLRILNEKHKVVAKFDSKPVFFVTRRDNRDLIEDLERAMIALEENFPSLQKDLAFKFYPLYHRQYYTKKEKEFIAGLGTLKVGYVKDKAPISDTDSDGNMTGITYAVMERLAEILGIHLKYEEVPVEGLDSDVLAERGIHIMTSIPYNVVYYDTENLTVSVPYLRSQKVLVGRKDGNTLKKDSPVLAVNEGFMMEDRELASRMSIEYVIREYPDVETCMEAVRTGVVDAALQNVYVARSMLGRAKYDNLYVMPTGASEEEMSLGIVRASFEKMGVSQENIDLLASALNKTISMIEEEEMESIVLAESKKSSYTYGLSDAFYRYRYMIGFFAAAILAVILILLRKLYKHTEAIEKRREEEIKKKEEFRDISRKDGLTGLLNKKTFMDEGRKHFFMNPNDKVGLLFIDLDNFKDLNDTLGHLVGDQVLKDVAAVLQRIFAGEVIARFGGDEYCVMVKRASEDRFESCLAALVSEIHHVYEAEGKQVLITASVGATYVKQITANFDKILDFTDNALYMAKEQGKNRYHLEYWE